MQYSEWAEMNSKKIDEIYVKKFIKFTTSRKF